MMLQPSARSIRHALGVLSRLPHEALFDLAERLVDRLDAITPDPELEPETDACEAEDTPITNNTAFGIGDTGDAEPDDDAEFDDHPALDKDGDSENEPVFPDILRSTRDCQAEARSQIAKARALRKDRPALAHQRTRRIMWEGRL